MFCPSCRAEYRPGFTDCAHCKVPLVEELPETVELSTDDLDDTVPVGLTSSTEVSRPAEIDGRVVDLMRVFALDGATEVREALTSHGVPVLMAPVQGVEFPDARPRFEVRVRPEDRERAESLLREAWASHAVETGLDEGSGTTTSVEECPACGAHVPLDAEECPDCGLVVGVSGADEEE